jgi:glucosyl-dolichyl phosphate glucuronosyltransferase
MGPNFRIDVLIPTHNRAAMVARCVRSVLNAQQPPLLDLTITVICNACSDQTIPTIRRLQCEHPGKVGLITERRRGKSRALNLGIAFTTGDLVAMVDDDEEVDPCWLHVIADAFKDDKLDFIGGPYVPVWERLPPEWVPPDYVAVLGGADAGPAARPYSYDFPGILKGGNAVVRRRVFRKTGPYAEHLGPGAFARLFSCEDEDMYWRLLKSGARGQYLPELVVYHYISESRLTPEYYRRWCFWRGVSRGLMDRAHPLPVRYFAGVPRFIVGRAARSLLRLLATRGTRPRRETFTDELRLWDLAGYSYGRHVYTLARFSPIKSRRASDSTAFRASIERYLATGGQPAELDQIELVG